MKGLELSRRYFYECAFERLKGEFSDCLPSLAIGLAGEGSECFGYDDDISQDHDFEPAFTIWLSDRDYDQLYFPLTKFYRSLPKQFLGYSRLAVSAAGGNRHGVMRISDFYKKFIGSDTLPKNLCEWFYIPSDALAAATNGEVFYDGAGQFSEMRNQLLCGYPDEVRLKKIAAHSVMLSQCGLYNYQRCIDRGERGAAELYCNSFVRHAIALVYLLNNKYQPFDKWVYRRMRELTVLPELEVTLSSLSEIGNSQKEAKTKLEIFSDICTLFKSTLASLGITREDHTDIEEAAFEIQNSIKNTEIRNMHIMAGI